MSQSILRQMPKTDKVQMTLSSFTGIHKEHTFRQLQLHKMTTILKGILQLRLFSYCKQQPRKSNYKHCYSLVKFEAYIYLFIYFIQYRFSPLQSMNNSSMSSFPATTFFLSPPTKFLIRKLPIFNISPLPSAYQIKYLF